MTYKPYKPAVGDTGTFYPTAGGEPVRVAITRVWSHACVNLSAPDGSHSPLPRSSVPIWWGPEGSMPKPAGDYFVPDALVHQVRDPAVPGSVRGGDEAKAPHPDTRQTLIFKLPVNALIRDNASILPWRHLGGGCFATSAAAMPHLIETDELRAPEEVPGPPLSIYPFKDPDAEFVRHRCVRFTRVEPAPAADRERKAEAQACQGARCGATDGHWHEQGRRPRP